MLGSKNIPLSNLALFFEFYIKFSIFATVLLFFRQLSINVTVTNDIEDGTDKNFQPVMEINALVEFAVE